MGTQTPWGKSDSSTKFARDVVLYTTPSHGGFHLSPTMNAKVHEAWRNPKGWYEEDVEYWIVVFTFPELFPGKREDAKECLKDYYPDQYWSATGVEVSLEESRVKRERAFYAAHKNDFVTIAAWGDWHANVPDGMVGVCATRGGERSATAEEKYFLVPANEYDQRGRPGFVVNPTHTEISKFY